MELAGLLSGAAVLAAMWLLFHVSASLAELRNTVNGLRVELRETKYELTQAISIIAESNECELARQYREHKRDLRALGIFGDSP